MTISILALFYGDYPAYAQRCLSSIEKAIRREGCRAVEVRLGANSVSAEVEALLRQFAEKCPLPVYLFEAADNLGKYPMMRRMLYDVRAPFTATHVMWFDDDAYLLDGFSWQPLAEALTVVDVVGRLYRWFWQPGQASWARRQPWCAHPERLPSERAVRDAQSGPRSKRPYLTFPQGSWWVAPYEFLRKWDWPSPEIHHNGGDSMFGVLCDQQGKKMQQFEWVCVNADLHGRESQAPRRGLNEKPTGVAGCVNGVQFCCLPVSLWRKSPGAPWEHRPTEATAAIAAAIASVKGVE